MDFGSHTLWAAALAVSAEVVLVSVCAILLAARPAASAKHARSSRNRGGARALVASFAAALLVSISFNAIFGIRYCYAYGEHAEKSAMIGIGNIVKDDFLCSPYAFSVCLYNETRPIATTGVEELADLFLDNEDIRYFVDYQRPGILVGKIDEDEKVLDTVAFFERSFYQMGNNFTVTLYEKVGTLGKDAESDSE